MKKIEHYIKLGDDLNIDDRTVDQGTPLTHAVKRNKIEIVRLLLGVKSSENNEHESKNECDTATLPPTPSQTKLNINAQKCSDGFTALLVAVNSNNVDLAKLLLEHGADPNIKGQKKETALKLAQAQHNQQMVDLLVSKGAIAIEQNIPQASNQSFTFPQRRIQMPTSSGPYNLFPATDLPDPHHDLGPKSINSMGSAMSIDVLESN